MGKFHAAQGHGNWELYEGPQTVGLQAFSGFPADAALGWNCYEV